LTAAQESRGVCLENIAIAQASFCLDVSSDAETEGLKDKEEMTALVKAVRQRASENIHEQGESTKNEGS
jgi:hypothetical protein